MKKQSFAIIVAIGLIACIFIIGNPLSLAQSIQYFSDLGDKRPTRKILILGNSRTFYNDMPAMLRKMADSAQDDHRLQFTIEALPGASLESLMKDPDVTALLAQNWDDVIVQAESRAQSNEENRQSFALYGKQMLKAAKARNGQPKLIVNWAYSNEIFPEARDPEVRRAFVDEIQSDYKKLAENGNASLVNVGLVWEQLLTEKPDIQLYEDGNHPSIAGSYLEALMLYQSLSPAKAPDVSYIPHGLTPDTSATLKLAVSEH